jgi:hypothetical protein
MNCIEIMLQSLPSSGDGSKRLVTA